jgi:adenine/guanine phosphoribosyltransferase-like PRPP-binding protein
MNNLNKAKQCFQKVVDTMKVVKFKASKGGTYNYGILPMEQDWSSDFGYHVSEAIHEVACKQVKNGAYDKIVVPETKGIHPGIAYQNFLRYVKGINVTVNTIRKRLHKTQDETKIGQTKAYKEGGEAQFSARGLNPGDSIFYVDDMASTGGTSSKILIELMKNKINIVQAVVVFDRADGLETMKKEVGDYITEFNASHEDQIKPFKINSLMRIDMNENATPYIEKFNF